MIGFLACNDGNLKDGQTLKSGSIMRWTGQNVGNLAFWYTTRRLFNDDVVFLDWKRPEEKLPKGIRLFVIPAANFLGEHISLAPLVEMIEGFDVPCVVVGLGAQSERDDVFPKVKPDVIQFVRAVSKRTPFIGLRGEYTQKFCASLGVQNTRVLSCPSILMNSDRRLGKSIQSKLASPTLGPLAIHGACLKGSLQQVERDLVRLVQQNVGSQYVVQRPQDLVATIFREQLDVENAANFASSAKYFGVSEKELAEFLQRFGFVPVGIDSWRSSLLRFAFSRNTRIHGTIVSIQSGIPGVCIAHDTRTAELIASGKLPGASAQDFKESKSDIRALLASISFSGEEFDENRRVVAQEYANLFRQVGLSPSPHLCALADEGGISQSPSVWEENIDHEVRHWEHWLGAPHLEDSRQRRITSTEILSPRLLNLLGAERGSHVRILDVGSGPISTIGRTAPDYCYELICVDALASQFNALLQKFGLAHLPHIQKVRGEDLESYFGKASFDLVHCANALDHFEDPAAAFSNMYEVCKPGGLILLISIENEGEREQYRGLHQWNLRADDKGIHLANKNSSINLLSRLTEPVDFSWRYLDHGQVGYKLFETLIKKPKTKA
jgi:SAM-dependent methyltransferase